MLEVEPRASRQRRGRRGGDAGRSVPLGLAWLHTWSWTGNGWEDQPGQLLRGGLKVDQGSLNGPQSGPSVFRKLAPKRAPPRLGVRPEAWVQVWDDDRSWGTVAKFGGPMANHRSCRNPADVYGARIRSSTTQAWSEAEVGRTERTFGRSPNVVAWSPSLAERIPILADFNPHGRSGPCGRTDAHSTTCAPSPGARLSTTPSEFCARAILPTGARPSLTNCGGHDASRPHATSWRLRYKRSLWQVSSHRLRQILEWAPKLYKDPTPRPSLTHNIWTFSSASPELRA